jgi:hypothetical protein
MVIVRGAMLTDEQIREVYRRISSTPKFREWDDAGKGGRAARLVRFQKWLLDVQGNGSDDDLRKGYLDHFENALQALNPIYRDRIVRDPGRFRKAIRELLDESVPVVTRLDRLLDGPQHIEGMGRGLATEYLMIVHPDKYCLWNGKSESGLAALDRMPVFARGQTSGQRYDMILRAVTELRDLTGSPSYPHTDMFLHFVGAPEEEGSNALRAVSQSQEEPLSAVAVPPSFQTRSDSSQSGVYVITPGLESRLEEFIESNLGRIGREKFGRDLVLFQDEEGVSGRQYTTPIGRIDLLTVDKEGKTWVVFELKRDNAGDSVVGQILRYVEWVKANKAKEDEQVHGVIIAAGSDKGLEYSLRALPDISLYTYTLGFDLKPSRGTKPALTGVSE